VKQRIMGLIILVAIALIFIPILFGRSASSINSQIKNAPPTVAALQPATTQLPPPNTPAIQQSPQPTDTAPDQIVLQSPDQTSATPSSMPTERSATPAPTENNVPNEPSNPSAASATPYTPVDNTNRVQNEQLVPAANPTVPVEQTNTSPAINPNGANPPGEATPPLPNNRANEPQNLQPFPTPSTTFTPEINTPASSPNARSEANLGTQPETTTQPSANQSIAVSESNVLQGAQRQFQPSPRLNSQSTPAATHAIPAKKPATKEQGWIVQLGMFAEQKNVDRLVQQLHNQGFVVRVKPIHTSHGIITRVYLGPEIHREQADRIAKQVKEHLAINSIVVPA
jgi:cell division septation protein DedD